MGHDSPQKSEPTVAAAQCNVLLAVRPSLAINFNQCLLVSIKFIRDGMREIGTSFEKLANQDMGAILKKPDRDMV